MSDRLARFINDEVLPAVLSNPDIRAAYPQLAFTDDPWGKCVMGCSSGGAAALAMGWFRPDLFRRLITYSGTSPDILSARNEVCLPDIWMRTAGNPQVAQPAGENRSVLPPQTTSACRLDSFSGRIRTSSLRTPFVIQCTRRGRLRISRKQGPSFLLAHHSALFTSQLVHSTSCWITSVAFTRRHSTDKVSAGQTSASNCAFCWSVFNATASVRRTHPTKRSLPESRHLSEA